MIILKRSHNGSYDPYPDFSPLYEPTSFSWWLLSPDPLYSRPPLFFNKATQEVTRDTAYYLSNYQNTHKEHTVNHLAEAIRKHWVFESNNWQLDVTFGEDSVKTKDGNQALVMGKLRCFSMNLIRWSKKGTTNFQTTIEEFIDSPNTLISMLK